MSSEVPSDLFSSLKSAIRENIEEYDIELESNEKGQGLAGEIIFVVLTHKRTKTKTELIVKQEIKGIESADMDFDAIFKNEIIFYKTIWPFLHEYYKNVSGKILNIVPKYFGSSDADCKRIILENITPQGYKLYDKAQPLDDDHYSKIFEVYGNYHGISMALREIDAEHYKRLMSEQINYLLDVYKDNSHPFCGVMKIVLEEVQKYFDPIKEKQVLEKIHLYEQLWPKNMYENINQEFPNGVILHGDCWSNNLMFIYNDDNKIQDVKLLDFQLARHGTPVFDLSNCLYSGATAEILSNLDTYLEIYHNSLSQTLNEFGLSAEKLYNFRTLKEEWKRYCKYGFLLGLFIWKVKLAEKDDLPDLTEGWNGFTNISGNKDENYRTRIRELVLHMYSNDFF